MTQFKDKDLNLVGPKTEGQALITLGPNGIISSWDAGAQALTGYLPKEIIGKDFSILHSFENLRRKKLAEVLTLATTAGKTTYEDWYVRKDGSHFWANLVITFLGKDPGYSVQMRPSSPTKQVEEEFRLRNIELEKQLHERTAELGVRTAQLGVSADELGIRTDQLGVRTDELGVRTSELGDQTTQLGERTIQLSAKTKEFNTAEALNKELEAQLRQSQKMEAIGRLAGGVAHDFNNILAVILLSLENIPPSSDSMNIEKAAGRATALTRQLLAFSRRQVLETTDVDVNLLVTESEKMLKRLIGENVKVVTDLCLDPMIVSADRGQIEQVIMNLVVNARDAMPEGGTLTLKTESLVSSDRKFDLKTESSTPYVLLSVRDTGTGMDATALNQIFEPFFTTKGIGQGSGRGLSTVFEVVKQSGGEIFVESELGGGSLFKIYLPQSKKTADQLAMLPGDNASLTGMETILVVEDEPELRQVTCSFLRKNGYTVHEASDGLEAIEFIKLHSSPIHLIVTDVIMPNMGGPEFVAQLPQLLKTEERRKVLYISGYSTEDLNENSNSEIETSIISKPFSSQVLLKKVREMLEQKTQL